MARPVESVVTEMPPPPLADLDWSGAERIGEVTGQASRLWRIGDRVVKHAHRQADAVREAAFYERWAPELDLPLPRLHLHHEAWLVLDWVEGDPGDALVGVSGERAAWVADALGALTQVALGDVAPEGLRTLLPRPAEFGPRIEAGLPHVLRHFPEHAALVHDLPARATAAVTRLGSRPGALCHGDLHVENVLFQRDRAVIIDWPNVGWGPLAIDVARFAIEGLANPTTWRAWAPHAADDVPDAAWMSLGHVAAARRLRDETLPERSRSLFGRVLDGVTAVL